MAENDQFDAQAAAQRLLGVSGLQAMQLLIGGQHGAPSIAKRPVRPAAGSGRVAQR